MLAIYYVLMICVYNNMHNERQIKTFYYLNKLWLKLKNRIYSCVYIMYVVHGIVNVKDYRQKKLHCRVK